MREVTGVPILFASTGEKLEDFDVFHPDRMASRILGMGDVLSLVEDVQRKVDQEKTAALAQKVIKGKKFDLNDMRDQLEQMLNMGGLHSLMDKLPGMPKLGDVNTMGAMGDKEMRKMVAIINSMTPKERRFPGLLNGSRKARVARGSGTHPSDINKLLKQYMMMEKMMKKLSGGGIKGMLRALKGGMGGMGGGMPPGFRR